MRVMARSNHLLILSALIGMLSGCAAGSMRVEVEVYKGPLVQPRASQYAELAGALAEARSAFLEWAILAQRGWDVEACYKPEVQRTQRECRLISEATVQSSRVANLIGDLLCKHASDISEQKACLETAKEHAARGGSSGYEKPFDAEELTSLVSFEGSPWSVLSKDKEKREKFLAGAVEVAARMKGKAFYTVYDELPDFPDKRLGPLLVGWTTLASTYSKELSARATTLLKQIPAIVDDGPAEQAIAGRKLSVGDHLRNANPDEFLYLLDWYNVVGNRTQLYEGMTEADRVRLGQRLFADQFWSKVNEVQASGQGDVRMAFIRDAIGNWNLKSFDNNPEKLLNAYRGVAEAGFDLAKNVAKAASTGGISEATDTALSMADQLINSDIDGSGGPAKANANPQVAVLRDRLAGDLGQIAEELKNARTAHDQKMADIEQRLESAETSVAALKKAEIATLQVTIDAKTAEKNGLDPNETEKTGKLKAEIAELEKQQTDIQNAQADSATKLKSEKATEEINYKAQVESLVERGKADIRSHLKILDGLKAAEVASAPN